MCEIYLIQSFSGELLYLKNPQQVFLQSKVLPAPPGSTLTGLLVGEVQEINFLLPLLPSHTATRVPLTPSDSPARARFQHAGAACTVSTAACTNAMSGLEIHSD